jgi:hypothetical protein
MQAHLDSCPSCAREAEQSDRFDRLWAASRPTDPGDAAWDQLWHRVTSGAERAAEFPEAVRFARAPGRARRWWTVAAVAAAAQAAALLIACVLVIQLRRTPVESHPPTTAAAAAPTYDFEIEVGQTLILELNDSDNHVVCKPRLSDTSALVYFDETVEPVSVADNWDLRLLNGMESIE